VVALSVLLAGLHAQAQSVAGHDATQPSQREIEASTPAQPISLLFAEQRRIEVPGRVQVVLGDGLWRKEFRPGSEGSRPRGVERLKITPELDELLWKYALESVRRSMPQLEVPSRHGVRVIGYPEWVAKHHRQRGMRKNGRPYSPPMLTSATATFELKFADSADLDALVEELRRVPGVIDARKVLEAVPQASYFPDDPGWVGRNDPIHDAVLAEGRWGFHNTGPNLAPGYLTDFDIDAPEAWEFQRGDLATVVAVLDNGVDVTHEDLYLNVFLNNHEVPYPVVNAHADASTGSGALTDDGLPTVLTFYDLNMPDVVSALAARGWSNTNEQPYIDGEDVVNWWGNCAVHGNDGVNCNDNDGNGFVDDLVGWNFWDESNRTFNVGMGDHGTPVAGLIAAIADNGIFVTGVAPRVRVLPVRNFSSMSTIVYALSFNEVRVINISQSYGFTGLDLAEIDALLATLEPEGVVLVASLHNGGRYTSGNDPSRREQVISANNFQPDGARSSTGSAFGPKTDVSAPGTGMYSLNPRTATAPGGLRAFGGTSAASPVTAGVAALVASEDPTLSPEQIRQVLRMTATDPAPVSGDNGENTPGWDLYSGWGLVNANDALAAVRNGTVFPEANILSIPVNYRNLITGEELSIQDGPAALRAYLGLPAGGNIDWMLYRSREWDLSGAVVEASGTSVGYSGGTATFHMVDTDQLDAGRHVLELEARTSQGVVGRDRAVIDLPRAYISNVTTGQIMVGKIPINGFAYGPGFVRYRILVAPGWNPASGDFVEVFSSTVEQAPVVPTVPGEEVLEKVLMPALDIFSIPVAFPASGEATLRVSAEGTATWLFDQQVIIDNTQPPRQNGFPVGADVLFSNFNNGAPTAADLDGDGIPELVVPGFYYKPTGDGAVPGWGWIRALKPDGSPLSGGWPVRLPFWWEVPSESIAVGDVDGDGWPELVVRSRVDWDRRWDIRVYNHDATEVGPGWPVSIDDPLLLNNYHESSSPVLADVTLDGTLDILLAVPKSAPQIPDAQIRAFGSDGAVRRTYVTTGKDLVSQPAVGDLDGDGESEVIALGHGADGVAVYAWNADGTMAWSREIDEPTSWVSRAQPVLADVDGDRVLEVIVTGGLETTHVFDARGLLLSSSDDVRPSSTYPHPIAAQLRAGVAPHEMSIIYSYKGSDGPGRKYVPLTRGKGQNRGRSRTVERAAMVVTDPLTGAIRSGWTGGVELADGTACSPPVAANLLGGPELELAWGNCPPDLNAQAEPEYLAGLLDADGGAITNGNNWPLRFPGPVTASPLVADLDGDGDLEYVVQAGGWYSRIHVYDLAAPAAPGSIAWGEYGHDARKSGNYHGGLRIVSPNTVQPALPGPPHDPSPVSVTVKFSRGVPPQSSDPTRWEVSIGGQVATINLVTVAGGVHTLLLDPVSQPAAGAYLLRVEYDDSVIRSWDSYRDAVSYCPDDDRDGYCASVGTVKSRWDLANWLDE
jgi:subtilisin family serine protease